MSTPVASHDWSALKAHFDATLRCGDRERLPRAPDDWVPVNGCGASDWRIMRIFFHPVPGNLMELECNNCKRKRGVTMEVAEANG